MDVNGTRYYLLLGRDDWASCTVAEDGSRRLADLWRPASREHADLDWDAERGELTLRAQVFRFVPARRDVPPSLDDRRGAGRDANGNWYWIAPDRSEILVLSSGSGRVSHFWSAADPPACTPEPGFGEFGPVAPAAAATPLALQGLAVTDDQYLVAGVLQPAGLLIFDLFAGGPPRQVVFPAGIAFVPFDLAARPAGGVWVLDRANYRYWAFDRAFNVVPRDEELVTLEPGGLEDFQPLGAGPADEGALRRREPRILPAGIRLEHASPLELADPIAIEGLPDGSVLILDHTPGAGSSAIHHFRFGHRDPAQLDTAAMEDYLQAGVGERSPLLLLGHDIAFVPPAADASPVVDGDRRLLGQLFVASAEGNQTFVFNLFGPASAETEPLSLEALPVYLPMRLFGGKAIVAGGGVVYYDLADRWLPLVEQHRPRHVESAVLHTPMREGGLLFDSRDPDCVWHRLFIDACLPPGAEVQVESRAANELAELGRAQWRGEPRPYRRSDGTELAYVQRQGPYDTWELLFQAARGRYLQLRLTLRGNGQTTPRIRSLRAYYPRFSYAGNYLPAVYREDPAPASFLDRFLANFEGIYTTIEERIAAAQTLFDPATAPQEALDWLASWFGVTLDPAWDEARRRLFIRHALLFFRQRGTLNGLQMALQLAFGDCVDERIFTTPLAARSSVSAIRIVEQFRTRRTPGVVLGDPTDPAGLQAVARRPHWQPAEGGAQLQARYAEFVAEQGLAGALPADFSPVAPADATALEAWTYFCRQALGFVPSTDAGELPRWRSFLARRYVTIDALDDRYRLTGATRYTSFNAIDHPATLPPDGSALQDWYQFQAVVLAMRRTQSRFAVLLPMPRQGYLEDAERAGRLALAKRVVELEKPAHTTFDVRFYWALFRVGEARLGYDTLVERGSRSPELVSAMILGQGRLVESHLASSHVAPSCRTYVGGCQR